MNEATSPQNDINQNLYTVGKDKPCTRCGGTYPYYIMEYHHIKNRISVQKPLRYLTQYCRGTTIEEIPGCIAVCAHCHRTIHWEARQETGKEAREDTQAAQWYAEARKRKEVKKQHWIAVRAQIKKRGMEAVFALVPADRAIPKNELIVLTRAAGVGLIKTGKMIKALIISKNLCVIRVRRPGTRSRVDLSRSPAPIAF